MTIQRTAPPHRLEDGTLLRGEGSYVDDMRLPGMLHATVLRSTHAHARIVSIDATEAERLPGVVGVFTAERLPSIVKEMPVAQRESVEYVNVPAHPVLADREVSYVGQAVAVAIADDRYLARDAAELIRVVYEPLEPALDARSAAKPGAQPIHGAFDSNIGFRIRAGKGDVDATLRDADHVIRVRHDVPRLVAAPIEPRGVLADYDTSDGSITVWSSTQVPHRVKEHIEELLDPPPRRVRVIAPYVGGGFGQKAEAFPEEIALAAIAMRLRRPIKWVEERSENMLAYHGRGFTADVEAGVMNDGRIVGMRYRVWADLGAYFLSYSAAPSQNVVQRVVGPYAVSNVDVECLGVLTNKPPTGPYRGAGGPEAAMFTERTIDLIAAELGMDPAELRRRNFILAEAFPYVTPTGLEYDSGDFHAAFDRALELADYAGWRERQREARAEGRMLGIGVATVVKASGGKGMARRSNAVVRVDSAGTVSLATEITPIGQGIRTSLAQIASNTLGVRPEDVDVQYGDTDQLPWGMGTFASRGLSVGGSAVYQGLQQAREKLAAVSAHLLQCSIDEIAFSDGDVCSLEMPDKRIPLSVVARAAHDPQSLPIGMEAGVEFAVDFTLPGNPFAFAAHVAVVEVERESGEVQILQYVAVHDCGPFLNPVIARGQIHGGIAQGLGEVFSESIGYDAAGLPLNSNFMTYGMPIAEDIPFIVTDNLETPSPTNPLGVKGIGELPTVATPAAVANALHNALAPIGSPHVDLPLSPEKVWRAIRDAQVTRS